MSNETKWTPGPWVVCPAGDIWSENLVSLVADTYSPVEANAHLIAAARELYDELADRYTQTKCGCGHGACRRCRDDRETERVLSKARGE